MIDIEEIKRIIHLSPARQNQVCFRAEIHQDPGTVSVTIRPTLDFYDQGRTGQANTESTYRSMLFHAGMTVASLETWCQDQGLRWEVERSIDAHRRDLHHLGGWLSQHRSAILGHIALWISDRTASDLLFKDYVYDMNKCVRDLGFLIDAIHEDLCFHTNKNVLATAGFYWDVHGQPVSRRPQELAIHREIRAWISRETQNHSRDLAQQILDLYDQFLAVIEHGPSNNAIKKHNDYIKVKIYE